MIAGLLLFRCCSFLKPRMSGSRLPVLQKTKNCPHPDDIVVDAEAGHIYWTNKGASPSENGGSIEPADLDGQNRICHANIKIPKGENAANRTDIEVLFDRVPEPIELELDLDKRVLYGTDCGNPPRGNTVNHASVDAVASRDEAREFVLSDLIEGIGIALDI
jgi:hypothetical protein